MKVAIVTFFAAFMIRYCVLSDDKLGLVQLRSICASSVQCVGVAVCMDRICRCPYSYMTIGNTCVHSGFENSLGSDQLHLRNLLEKDAEISEGMSIGSSLIDDKYPLIILSKLQSTLAPMGRGYPGQSCGEKNECKGNSFCYKGVCSCHAGSVVSGRVCANIISDQKSTKSTTPAPRTRNTQKPVRPSTTPRIPPIGMEEICPPPSFWADGDCMVPISSVTPSENTATTIADMNTAPTVGQAQMAMCKPPLVIVDGWCILPITDVGKGITDPPIMHPPKIQGQCLPPSIWYEGRCVILQGPSMQSFLTPFTPPVQTNPINPTGIDAGAPLYMQQSTQSRRCPSGEILINSACLSTAVVANYPSPLLCRANTDCPGGANCLTHFCICPAPFVWHSTRGCDSPSMLPVSRDVPASKTVPDENESNQEASKNYPVPKSTSERRLALGGRCRRDDECIERAVCEFGLCICRAPFIPYSSICIFAPTEEEIATAIQ